MKFSTKILTYALALAIFATSALVAEAQRPYRVSDREVRNLLTRIDTKTNTFRVQMNNALNRSNFNNTSTENMVREYIRDFETSAEALRRNYNNQASANNDVYFVMQKASVIDSFMRSNNLTPAAQTQWRNLRTDLNTLARYYNVAWNWNGDVNNNNNNNSSVAYTVSNNQVRSLLSQLESNTDRFKNVLDTALDRSALNNTRSEDSINNYVTDFERATNSLKQNFNSGRSTDADVESVLSKGYIIDGFMRDYRLMNQAENQWQIVRRDLNNLANYYAVSINWNSQAPIINQFDSMLDGTYRLNTSMSDDVNSIIQNVTNSYYTGAQRDRMQKNLQRRLVSPEYFAIDKNGNNITIASNLSPQVTFQADGYAKTENLGNRQVKVTGRTNYDSVSLSYEGDKINDFYVSFMPMNNGKLRIVRRVNLENRNETVAVSSVYDKVNQVADFSWTNNQNNNNQNNNSAFYVPNGTRLTAVLNETLSTKTVKEGERFTLTVNGPSQYTGSTIYGYVSTAERSGRFSGRAVMTFNFEQIRLRNGSMYNFRGIVEEVTDSRGNRVSVNNEGVVRDGNQTTKTVVRSGVGAAIGAIIGAVISGGDGAAIGAAIGGSAGAGSVIAQGRDDLNLEVGSQIIISSTAPTQRSANR